MEFPGKSSGSVDEPLLVVDQEWQRFFSKPEDCIISMVCVWPEAKVGVARSEREAQWM